MALLTYSDLKSSICNWMIDRQDLAVVAADCISLSENDMNKILRTRKQHATAEITPVDGVIDLPPDYLAWRSVTALTSPRRPLEAYSQGTFDDLYTTRHSGSPEHFVVDGPKMHILPATEAVIELKYYKRVPALTDEIGKDTNWLLSEYPNMYLWGSLKYAAIYIVSPDKASMYGSLFSGALDALVIEDQNSVYGNRTIARIRGVTP
jgi:hypothetical protein